MDFGGIERGVYDFALKARETGHSVAIVSGGGAFIRLLQGAGIKWHNVPMDRKNLFVFLDSCRRLKKIVEEEGPDIIHFQSRFTCWIASSVMKFFPHIPWVTSIHNFHGMRWYSRSVAKGNLVITVSKALERYAVEYLKAPAEILRVVYNGIDDRFLDITRTPSDIPVIGMIARLTAWKGHFIFLEAIKKLHNEGIRSKALIVGSGSDAYRTKLEKWISENKMHPYVEIVRMDGMEALGKIDLLVVPSLEPEGFGRTVVEAQMAGTPVIATNLGAVPELIEEAKTGFLVEPGNIEQLAYKIKFILQNPGVVSNAVSTARQNALENFTVRHMTEKILGVYRELL